MANRYILGTGQSNMDGRQPLPLVASVSTHIKAWDANTAAVVVASDPISQYDKPGDVDDDSINTLGSAYLTLCNDLVAQYPDDDIIIVNAAKGGSAISAWARNEADHDDPTTLYGNAISKLAAAGANFATDDIYVIWHQGESDTGTDRVTYSTALDTFISNIHEDILDTVPILICSTGKWPTATAQTGEIRALQCLKDDGVKTISACVCYAYTSDAGAHYNRDAYISMGHRLANAILWMNADAPYYRSPYMSSARFDSVFGRTQIIVSITKPEGTTLNNPACTGWIVKDGDGSAVVPSSIAVSGSTVVLTFASALKAWPTVEYMMEANPDTSGTIALTDSFALPLEPGRIQVTYSGAGGMPTLIFGKNTGQAGIIDTGHKDTWIRSSDTDSANGAHASLIAQRSNLLIYLFSSLLRFDISSAGRVPSNAIITSATLSLFLRTAPTSTATYFLYLMTHAWGVDDTNEGATANPATDGGATYRRAIDKNGAGGDVDWTTPGAISTGDYNSAVGSSFVVASTDATGTRYDIDILAIAQQWQANPLAYHGLILMATTSTTNSALVYFDSQNYATGTTRPYLTLSYILPSSVNPSGRLRMKTRTRIL